MKGVVLRYAGLILLGVGLAASARAADVQVTDADRTFRNFTRDAATVGRNNLRLALRGFYLQDDTNPKLDLIGFPLQDQERRQNAKITAIEGGVFDLLGSYGLGENAELGFDVPLLTEQLDLRQSQQSCHTCTKGETDMGDVLLYGKFKRKAAEHCAWSLGLEMTLPTGIEKKAFGTGSVGWNPFLSSRWQRGRYSLGAHVGYYIYTNDTPDVLNYSGTAIARGSNRWLLRIEITGRMFKDYGRTFNDVMILPALDINVTDKVTLRPTFMAGITGDALDWGGGLGVAVALPL